MEPANMVHDQPTLWGQMSLNYGESELEATVRETLDEIHAKRTLNAAERSIARLCRALAQNIDRGNAKGRAVANEAAQLAQLLNQLQNPETVEGAGDSGGLDPEVQRMMDAFAAPPAPVGLPGLGDAPTGDDAP